MHNTLTASKWICIGLVVACTPSSVASGPSGRAGAHAYRYDLVVTGPEATDTTRVSMAVSDATPGYVSFGKNVRTTGANRADVGMTLEGAVTMDGDTPRLSIEAKIGSIDAAGALHRAVLTGTALTPLGTATVVADMIHEGKPYRVTATPTEGARLGGAVSNGDHTVDVLASTTPLTLAIHGSEPATATHRVIVPLQAMADGGAPIPRQDTGTRVKAVAHAHESGLELDLSLELSAAESDAPTVAIRKLVTRGPVLAPFGKTTTAFSAEEHGHRYEVMVTPRP